jgi:hypothetical protein
MVSLTIDDKPVSVPAGTLIIRAAETLGIEIPRFCDHPLLDPDSTGPGATSSSATSSMELVAVSTFRILAGITSSSRPTRPAQAAATKFAMTLG